MPCGSWRRLVCWLTGRSLLALLAVCSTEAAPRVKVIKLAGTTLTPLSRPSENIAIPVGTLQAIAKDFTAGTAIVTTSQAETLDQDAHTLQTTELASQADDLDGDGQFDEIAFQIDLQPRQTRIVTIAYGDAAAMLLLRSQYPKRTNAQFEAHCNGPGWESEQTAWRICFDRRNAVEVYGKSRPGLYLDLLASPEDAALSESPFGPQLISVGKALGVAGLGALVDGKVLPAADVAERHWRLISAGPVRSMLGLEYKGWKIGGRGVEVVSRITQWAGEHGFEHRITVTNGDGLTLVTGIPTRPGAQNLDASISSVRAVATWGGQADDDLGLAVLTPRQEAGAEASDERNRLLRINPRNGVAQWYGTAIWGREAAGALAIRNDLPGKRSGEGTLSLPKPYPPGRAGFVAYLTDVAARIAEPARVEILSKTGAPESAPPDTLAAGASHRTYAQAFFFSPCALSLIRSMLPCVLELVKRPPFMPKTMSMRIFSRNFRGPGGQRNLTVTVTLPVIPGWSFANRYSRSSTRPSGTATSKLAVLPFSPACPAIQPRTSIRVRRKRATAGFSNTSPLVPFTVAWNVVVRGTE